MSHHHHHDHHAAGGGHAHDRGWRGTLRYLRMARRMWASAVSDAVVDMVDPGPGERVVDLGAGMGPATIQAAMRGAGVVAVDPNRGMRGILSVRRRLGRHTSRIAVAEGVAESIPVATASADALWCVNAVHHWTERTAALAEIARVLRPGGRLVLVDEDFADPAHPWHESHRRRAAARRHHFHHVVPDELAGQVAAAGLSVEEAATRPVAGRPAHVLRATRT